MNADKNNKIKISIFGIILLVSIVIVVLLSQKQQNIRSKASPQDVYNALDVTDTSEKPLEYKDENNVRTYETQSLDIKVRVNDLEKLMQNE